MSWIAPYQTYLTEEQSLYNAQLVVNHFSGTDWSRESLSAMLGNMRHESTVNPNMYEIGYSWGDNRGFGLVQWTPRTNLSNWTDSQGLNFRDGDAQLARIDFEVENNIQWIPKASVFNGLTFKEFRTNSKGLTIAELTEAFMWGYERPNARYGRESLPDRIAFAERANNELDWSGTSGGGSGGCLQLAELPIKWMYVTQGENGQFSHQGTLAMDFDGKDGPNYSYYAPFDCECIGRDEPNAIATWKSLGKVYCADGTPRDIVFRCIHDDNLLYNVGDFVMKGELLGATGNSGQSAGDHLHLDVWEGTTFTRENPLHIYDVFAVNGVEIVNSGGYDWIVSSYKCDGTTPGITVNEKIIDLLLSDALNGWKF